MRVEYRGAINHLLWCGNMRGSIFDDEPGHRRTAEELEQAATRLSGESSASF
jgi:hypothetical protein